MSYRLQKIHLNSSIPAWTPPVRSPMTSNCAMTAASAQTTRVYVNGCCSRDVGMRCVSLIFGHHKNKQFLTQVLFLYIRKVYQIVFHPGLSPVHQGDSPRRWRRSRWVPCMWRGINHFEGRGRNPGGEDWCSVIDSILILRFCDQYASHFYDFPDSEHSWMHR